MTRKALRIGPQLAGRDRARTENGCDRRGKECGFDYFFAHGRSYLHDRLRMMPKSLLIAISEV
jgi:hypothetical protein